MKAAVDYLLYAFPGELEHSKGQWVEAFGCTDSLEGSEGLGGLSLATVAQIEHQAKFCFAQHTEESWAELIRLGDLRKE